MTGVKNPRQERFSACPNQGLGGSHPSFNGWRGSSVKSIIPKIDRLAQKLCHQFITFAGYFYFLI